MIGVTVVKAREPVLSCANGFQAQIGQNKIDGRRDRIRVGVQPQQFVRRAVRAGGVRAHAKAHRDRLKILLLFMNAVAAAPPPRLMHKRAVRRIHEADDSVIDAAWQICAQAGDLVASAESWNLRSARRRLRRLGRNLRRAEAARE